jgi:hypothetical protein
MQIGLPIRIVGLVGLLAALAIGAWTFAAGRSGTDTSSSGTTQAGSVAQHPIAAAQAVADKLSAHNKATAAGRPDVAPQATPSSAAVPHVRKSIPAPVTHVRKATPAAQTGNQMPTTLASALRLHPVAVVLVYDPQVKIGRLSLGEAQLGAEQANVSFLRVNVLKQSQSEPFARRYGVLQVPTVLFFARPGKLVQKLSGFADQETVAQAALIAAAQVRSTEPRLSASLAAWRDRACAIDPTVTGKETPRAMKSKLTAIATALVAIPLPSAPAERTQVRGLVSVFKKLIHDTDRVAQARLRGSRAATAARLAAFQRDVKRGDALTKQLGLSACR